MSIIITESCLANAKRLKPVWLFHSDFNETKAANPPAPQAHQPSAPSAPLRTPPSEDSQPNPAKQQRPSSKP